MHLNEEEIRSIAEWRQLEGALPQLSENEIHEGLSKNLGSTIYIWQLDLAESGLSNYDSFFISKKQQGKCPGLLLYVSSLAPIAAMSEATIYFSLASGSYSYSGIEPDQLLEPKNSSDLADALSSILLQHGYYLLSKAEALAPLPDGVQPYEYCLNKEPWDKVFHVLFSNTD